jgi:hypothetical protein
MISPAKVLGSIEREVRALSTTMFDSATRLLAMHPDAGLTVRRTPDHVILQAGNISVSVSFFRSRAGSEANIEVVLAVWQGEVTFPGSARREGSRATRLSAQQFHIVACDDSSWVWMDEATTDTMTSQALAAACIGTMAERLPVSVS